MSPYHPYQNFQLSNAQKPIQQHLIKKYFLVAAQQGKFSPRRVGHMSIIAPDIVQRWSRSKDELEARYVNGNLLIHNF